MTSYGPVHLIYPPNLNHKLLFFVSSLFWNSVTRQLGIEKLTLWFIFNRGSLRWIRIHVILESLSPLEDSQNPVQNSPTELSILIDYVLHSQVCNLWAREGTPKNMLIHSRRYNMKEVVKR